MKAGQKILVYFMPMHAGLSCETFYSQFSYVICCLRSCLLTRYLEIMSHEIPKNFGVRNFESWLAYVWWILHARQNCLSKTASPDLLGWWQCSTFDQDLVEKANWWSWKWKHI